MMRRDPVPKTMLVVCGEVCQPRQKATSRGREELLVLKRRLLPVSATATSTYFLISNSRKVSTFGKCAQRTVASCLLFPVTHWI